MLLCSVDADTIPSYVSLPPGFVFLYTQPDEDRSSYDMIFGHETPVAAICRVVAIITHHPIVVHLKCVGCTYMDGLMFVGICYALIDPIVVFGYHDDLSCVGHIYRAVVISSPCGMS